MAPKRPAADTCIDIIGTAYRDAVRMIPRDEHLLTAPAWRQRLARAEAIVEGTPPGVAGKIVEQGTIVHDALRQVTGPEATRIGRSLNKQIKAELSKLRYTGPAENADLLPLYGDKMLVQHPEWFAGKSAQLDALLNEAQTFQRNKLAIAKALDYPIEALDEPYLEQMWEPLKSPLISRVNVFPQGRVSIAKERVFGDYVEGIRAGMTPKEMSVGELVEHSSSLMDKAIADAFERRLVLERFGSRQAVRQATSYRPFNSPLYRGWNGPMEIVNFIDQSHQMVGAGTRTVQKVVDATKNSMFGLDFGVFGVQILRNLAFGSAQTFTGVMNRSLALAHLPHFSVFLDQNLPRAVQASVRGGVHIGMGPSVVRVGQGTLLKYIPLAGKYLDKPVAAVVDELARIQFGGILTQLRLLRYEGDLTMLHLLGRNIDDPKVLRTAGDWANAATGASRGAMTPGRKVAEQMALTSAPMVRAEAASWMQLVNATFNPKATAEERLLGMITLASFAGTVYGTKLALENAFGEGGVPDPREVFDPTRSDWATVKLKGWQIPLVPQRALVRAIGKSIEGLKKEDPDAVTRAWAQFAVGKANPALSGALGLAGYGFEPGEGFKAGDLSRKARLLNLAPLPLTLGQALEEPESRQAASIGMSIFGLNPWPESREDVARRVFEEEGIPFDPATWRTIAASDPRVKDRIPEAQQSEEAEQLEAVAADQADDLRPLVERYRENPAEEAPRLLAAYEDIRTKMAGATALAYFGRDFERESEAGRLLDELNALNIYEFEDPGDFFDQREALLDRIENLSPGYRAALDAKMKLPEDMEDVEAQLKQVSKLRSDLYDIPHYRGVSVEDDKAVRDLEAKVATWQDEQPRRIDTAIALRRVGAQEGVPDDIIRMALRLSREAYRQRAVTPEYLRFLGEHREELEPFYGGLYPDYIERRLRRR